MVVIINIVLLVVVGVEVLILGLLLCFMNLFEGIEIRIVVFILGIL